MKSTAIFPLCITMLHHLPAINSFRITLRHPRRSFHSSTPSQYGYPHKSPPLYLNRILFDSSEIDKDININSSEWMASVTFPKSDYRTIHIAKILGLKNGDTVRAGSVIHSHDTISNSSSKDGKHNNNDLQGLQTDHATIQWLPEGKIKSPQPTKNGEPPGSLRLFIPKPPHTILHTTTEYESPPVSLLLALPRPLQLQRILPQISQMGVDTLILTHASKVPKDYFGSHLFRKPNLITEALIEGLTLSGCDLKVPNVVVWKRPVKELLNEMIEERFGEDEWVRVIAHPERRRLDGESEEDVVVRMTDVDFPTDKNGRRRRILVAVGPEGGWEEPEELEMFMQHGFQKVTLGTRVLRSDVAVVSLLALANEVCSKSREDKS